ncbi:hypothetical protein C2S52_011653 [Perilla frutescens var. hirtella]|nr:hypothetical protein C2S52_011653 [Perilla frutescens var. hirtella]
MKFQSMFLIAILVVQAFVVVEVSSSVSDAEKSVSQQGAEGNIEELMKKHRPPTITMHAEEDAASHQERMCAIALARAVARRAIASLQAHMATKTSAPAMLS